MSLNPATLEIINEHVRYGIDSGGAYIHLFKADGSSGGALYVPGPVERQWVLTYGCGVVDTDADVRVLARRNAVIIAPPISLLLDRGLFGRVVHQLGTPLCEADAPQDDGELIEAAMMYCRAALRAVRNRAPLRRLRRLIHKFPQAWPWGAEAWSPSPSTGVNLSKAVALLVAEYDRLHTLRNALPPSANNKGVLELQTYAVEHHHRHGVSFQVVRSAGIPSVEAVVFHCSIPYEPEEGETIEIYACNPVDLP